jgi:[acyl-carrier-protein] S-malonyltransferase
VDQTCARLGVDVANYNCPGQVVISGPQAEVAEAVAALTQAGVKRVVPLEVHGAFHSRLMRPAAERFAAVLAAAPLQPPRVPVVQNVTGGAVTDVEEIRRNLARQVDGSVRWESCVRAMLACGATALLEFGPGQTLAGFVRRIDRAVPVCSVGSVADLEKAAALLTAG